MSFEDHPDFARQVADLNRYGQALNSCESVEEVVSLTLEAVTLLFDFSYATFVEVRSGTAEVIESTNPRLGIGEEPSSVVEEAIQSQETVIRTGADAGTSADSDVTATLAVPASIVDEVAVVLVIRATATDEISDEHARPLEILASHAATAVSNIRSREQLERARNDLQKRKEMIELYDRLLRHDMGNELQVIAGFSEVLLDEVEGDSKRYAKKINRAAESSTDLIQRVGDLVSTLEDETRPEPQSLQSVLEPVVSDVDAKYESLTVAFDPEDVSYQVYAGDLLDSVFTNVLSNAAVHNDGPVTVRVYAAEPAPDQVVVGFADDGAGIPASIRDELFEMGKKGPESAGTGFGLGFVRALTESYGGTVAVRESEWGGADIRVTLERV